MNYQQFLKVPGKIQPAASLADYTRLAAFICPPYPFNVISHIESASKGTLRRYLSAVMSLEASTYAYEHALCSRYSFLTVRDVRNSIFCAFWREPRILSSTSAEALQILFFTGKPDYTVLPEGWDLDLPIDTWMFLHAIWESLPSPLQAFVTSNFMAELTLNGGWSLDASDYDWYEAEHHLLVGDLTAVPYTDCEWYKADPTGFTQSKAADGCSLFGRDVIDSVFETVHDGNLRGGCGTAVEDIYSLPLSMATTGLKRLVRAELEAWVSYVHRS